MVIKVSDTDITRAAIQNESHASLSTSRLQMRTRPFLSAFLLPQRLLNRALALRLRCLPRLSDGCCALLSLLHRRVDGDVLLH
jgi:hypothetical protein